MYFNVSTRVCQPSTPHRAFIGIDQVPPRPGLMRKAAL